MEARAEFRHVTAHAYPAIFWSIAWSVSPHQLWTSLFQSWPLPWSPPVPIPSMTVLDSKEPVIGEWKRGRYPNLAQQGKKDWGLRVTTACKTRHPHWRERRLSPISKLVRFDVSYQRQPHSSKWQSFIREPSNPLKPRTDKTDTWCWDMRGQPLSCKRHSLGDFLFSVGFGEVIHKGHHCPDNLMRGYFGSAERSRWVQRNHNSEVPSSSLSIWNDPRADNME